MYALRRKEYTVCRQNQHILVPAQQNFVTVKWEIYEGTRQVATYNLKRDAVNRLNLLNKDST